MRARQVYTDGDLAQILGAVAVTGALAAGHSPRAAEFNRGFAAALAAVATATGVPLTVLAAQLRAGQELAAAAAAQTPEHHLR